MGSNKFPNIEDIDAPPDSSSSSDDEDFQNLPWNSSNYHQTASLTLNASNTNIQVNLNSQNGSNVQVNLSSQNVSNTNVQINLRIASDNIPPPSPESMPHKPREKILNLKRDLHQINNPYLDLPYYVLYWIAKDRDIEVVGSADDIALQLFELDQIMPEWINKIKQTNFENFESLGYGELIMFCILNNIDLTEYFEVFNNISLRKESLCDYIHFFLMIKHKEYTDQDFQALLSVIDYNVKEYLLPKIFSINSEILCYCLKIIGLEKLRDLKGDPNSKEKILNDPKIQRFLNLRSHSNVHLISKLYDIDPNQDFDSELAEVVRKEPKPFEKVLLEFDRYEVPLKFIKDYGVMIPPPNYLNPEGEKIKEAVEDYIKDYVLKNIVFYSSVTFKSPKSEDLETLTDLEIFELTQVLLPFKGRAELVQKSNEFLKGSKNHFFYPLKFSKYQKNSKNKEFLSSLEEIDNIKPETPIICYGNAKNFFTYALEDLITSFSEDSESGVTDFLMPDNPKKIFSDENILSLRDLLNQMSNDERVIEIFKDFNPKELTERLLKIEKENIKLLLSKISNVFLVRSEAFNGSNQLLKSFRGFSLKDQNLIGEFLKNVFYTAMYMRRWLGPGNPYPVNKEASLIKIPEFNVFESVQNQSLIVTQILNQMSPEVRNFCLNLKTCMIKENFRPVFTFNTFEHVFDTSAKHHDRCIRITSNELLRFSVYYYHLFFDQIFEGINIFDIYIAT